MAARERALDGLRLSQFMQSRISIPRWVNCVDSTWRGWARRFLAKFSR